MKKIITIAAAALVALLPLVFLLTSAEAERTIFKSGSSDELERAKQISLEILRSSMAQRGIAGADELKVQKVEIDELNMAHTRVRQTIGDVPVWEGEAIVHLKSDGSLATVTDDLKAGLSVSTQPNFSADEAVRLALEMYKGGAQLTDKPKVDLWIFRAADRDHLTYRVEMPHIDGSEETAVPVIFVDAQTGEKVFQYDNLQTGSGPSLYSGTVNITTDLVGSTYYMEDTGRKMGTFNMNNTGNTSTGTGGTQSRYSDTNDVWDATNQRAGVDAHYGAAMTFDYFKNVHGRTGINGSGGPGTTTSADGTVSMITSRVHFGSNYNNAFWYNNQMTYGDGNGSTFSPLVTLDIAGHEMTHGVTQYTANLTYANESGALNESMSDVFGAMVERYAKGESANTWKIGEECYTPSNGTGDALRYMDNPHLAGNGGYTSDDDPDHYAERYTGTADSGGVHINSGIANKAFYMAAKGGTHHRSNVTVTGMGADNAARIWYRALTVYMTSGTNFSGARTATLNAATDLFGSSSTQYTATATAWCAVGVGSCPSGTPTPTPTATPTPTPSGSELLVNGGFEGSASPWVGSGSGYFYIANGNYPRSGTGYIYFGVNNSVSGQSYQQVTIPSTATGSLTFWLNVTSSESTTTTQYDRLYVEVRNTSGTLLSTIATYSNLNKGTAGVYSQKSLSLAAYKGQTVRLQFRATTDSSLATTFRVDDVSLK